jgi:hypothetical protein
MSDLVEVLRGIDSTEVEDRRPTGEKNTFAIGPEPEADTDENDD